MMAQISRAARSIVYIGAALAFLLILVIMSPRLLPNQLGTVADPTAVPSVSVDPAPTLEATEIDPASKGSFLYLVSEGETLFGIADKFNLKPETVLWSNSDLLLDNPRLIQPDMILRIPSVDGLYYRWETGDTVEAVAAKFGAEPQAIRDWPENQKGTRESGDLEIQAGTLLFVPGGKMPLQPVIPPTTEDTNTKRIISPDGRYAAVYQHGPGLLRIEDVQSSQTQISGFSGVVNPGNWSPDSRYLLYWENTVDSASIQADGLPLWTLDVGTSEARLISTTLVNPYYQSWSPDGRKLIFTNGGYRSAQVDKWLSIYNTSTGEVRDLIPKEVLVPGAIDWSPDGKWIAVAAVEGSKTGPEYADYMSWDNPAIAARRIYLVDPMTGDFRRLTQSEVYEDAPRWSEDGKQLLFVQAEGSQARLMTANLETGEVDAVQGCVMPMPPSPGYYGQADWAALYDNCPAGKPQPPIGTETPEVISPAALAEFELYFYRPLVVDYDPIIWKDLSQPESKEKMVNSLQHRELASCIIGVRGPSGFYPENMQDMILGDITYQLNEQELAGGAVVRDYFFKSKPTDAFDEVLNTIGIPILQIQYQPSEGQDCLAAAEGVFATLRPSDRLIQMTFCEKLARDYRTPPNYITYCDPNFSFAFDYPEDWWIEALAEIPDSAAPHFVRRVQRFQKPDMSNYIRVDTYRLPETRTLEDAFKAFFAYDNREFPDHEYTELRIGSKRAYAMVRRSEQDINAVFLFFEHGEYYTVFELKAITAPKLDTNWKIARSIQIPGATLDDNFIPDELLIDSYQLVR